MKEKKQKIEQHTNNTLERLIDKIINTAEKEAETILRETKKELEEIEKETEVLVDEIKEKELQKESSRLEFIRKRTETEYQQKAKKIIIQTKEDIIDQVFENVEKHILKVREDKRYSKYLENLLNSTINNIVEKNIKLIGDKRDEEILTKIAKSTTKNKGLEFVFDFSSLITLGGFIITDIDERIRINHTVENMLKVSREKIRTKINEIMFM